MFHRIWLLALLLGLMVAAGFGGSLQRSSADTAPACTTASCATSPNIAATAPLDTVAEFTVQVTAPLQDTMLDRASSIAVSGSSPSPSFSPFTPSPSPSFSPFTPSPSPSFSPFTPSPSPSFSPLTPTLTNGKPVLTLTAADSGQTAVVPVETSIFLRFGPGDYVISVDPATGVLEAPQGAFALPRDDIGLLVAVGLGSATITVQLPPAGTRTAGPSTSGNWSGYVATSTTYTNIGGSWVVPSVQSSTGFTASSSWIGIDGNGNTNLIQTGTEQDYTPGSGASYHAWWEIIPAPETQISTSSYPVNPGDDMFAEISRENGSTWYILLEDTTAGWAFSTQQTYSGPLASAEWIQEATSFGKKGGAAVPATLAKYGSTSFTDGFDNDPNGETEAGLTASEELAMVQAGAQVSTPSAPNCTTDGFNVAYGAAAPVAPTCPFLIATVPPTLSLSVPTVTAGNTVTVTGQAFADSGETVTLTLTSAGVPIITLGTATVSQGSFSTTVTVPANTGPSSYMVHAQATGAQADAALQVIAFSDKGTLTVTDPSDGSVATSISTDYVYTLTGNNFAPGFGVTLYLDSKTGPQLGTATAGLQDESFTMTFHVTAGQIGNKNGNHALVVVSEGSVVAQVTLPFVVSEAIR